MANELDFLVDTKKDDKHLSKTFILGLTLFICLLTSYYFHFILKTEIIHTHLFFVPIVLASLWWARKGIVVSYILALALIVMHILSPVEKSIWLDLTRAFVFVIVGTLVAILNEKNMILIDKLQQSEDKLEGIVNSVTDPIFMVDEQFTIIWANDIAKSVYRADMIGEKCYSVCQKLDEVCESCIARKCFEDGKVHEFETETIGKDGDKYKIWCTASVAAWHEDGTPKMIVESLRDITEREKNEEILRESEKKYSTIVENGNDGIIFIQDGLLKFANQKIYEMTGFTREESIGRPFLEGIAPEYREFVKKMSQNRLKSVGKVPSNYEIEMLSKDGNKIPVDVNISLIEYEARPTTLVILRDITERKKAEKMLKASEKKYSTLVEKGNDGIIFLQDGILKFANKKMAEMTGFAIEEGIGRPFLEFVSPEFWELAQERYLQSLNSNGETLSSYVVDILSKDGTKIPVEISPSLIEYEGKPAFMAIIRDIIEHRKAENILQEQREFAANMINYSAVPTFVIDSQHTVLQWNKACEDLTGIKASDIVGTDNHWKAFHAYKRSCLADIIINKEFHGLPGYYDKYERSEHIVNGLHAENWVQNMGGKSRYLIFDAAPINDREGKLIAVVETLQDITELKKMEEMRLENERLVSANKTKSEFLSVMSHELRTPLTSIIGYSMLCKERRSCELDEKQGFYMDKILSCGLHLRDLINSTLDLAKIEAGKMEISIGDMSVPETVTEIMELVQERAAQHDVVLRTEFDPDLDLIKADSQKFKQILFNLLSNAIKFSKEDGGIVTIRSKKDGDMAMISVSDTGIGIKKEDVPKLFKEFGQLDEGTSRKYEGTGLGLAITRQLVKMHGGTIKVESEYGEGSSFTFSIPIGTEKKD
ncbi:MAG: PAS domain S-box protein [Methanosarcinaceae archaeon]|nr:PAS domain S-box protein [Methanosarcinaceae archaeon]